MLLSATTAACTSLWPKDTHITTHTMTQTGIVTPHPTLTISPADITHATPQNGVCLTLTTPTTQHKNLIPERPNNAQDPQHPINPTSHGLSPSRTPLQIHHQIQTLDKSPLPIVMKMNGEGIFQTITPYNLYQTAPQSQCLQEKDLRF